MIRFLTMALLLTGLAHARLHAQDQGSRHKIVFQFTNGDSLQQKAFTQQLKNVTELWPKASIEVVVYNQGIEYMKTKTTRHHDDIRILKEKGVRFVVCENTLKMRKIDKSEIIPEAGFVPSGIGEIVLKQEQKWSYVKGGF